MQRIDCEGAKTADVAIELSKGTWMIGDMVPDRDKPSICRLPRADSAGLLWKLEKLEKLEKLRHLGGDRLILCPEAGHDGFWPVPFLLRHGIEVRVLDPASLQVNRRARQVKTDRIDVLSLLNALVAIDCGERQFCSIVRVLSVEEEDARRSHREVLIHERTAHINRIKGLLFAQSIREVEPRLRKSRIDFGALRIAAGHPIPPRLRAELEREYARLDVVEGQFRAVEKERDLPDAMDPAVEAKRQWLEHLHGVGGSASSILAREAFARSFASRRHIASYPGLTPSVYDSGRSPDARASPGRATAGGRGSRSRLLGFGCDANPRPPWRSVTGNAPGDSASVSDPSCSLRRLADWPPQTGRGASALC